MMNCIKCGIQIPEGELFCEDCGLNRLTVKSDDGTAVHIPHPKGRMQPPQQPPRAEPVIASQQDDKRRGLARALTVVSLLLAGALGLMAWQFIEVRQEKIALSAREQELASSELEIEELLQRLETLEQENEDLLTTIADRELRIRELESRLSDQSPTGSASAQTEADRLREENLRLSQKAEELQKEIDELLASLQETETDREKAAFLDGYVVFVENDGTKYYHTYDCENFRKNSFWAYSRKLAENNGYSACPDCKGQP